MLSLVTVGVSQTSAEDTSNSATASNPAKTVDHGSKTNKSSSSTTPSDSDIAAAKAAGKVWVNLDSGIYHKNGRWYGKTKNGKFMSESEAKAAGYKQSQRN